MSNKPLLDKLAALLAPDAFARSANSDSLSAEHETQMMAAQTAVAALMPTLIELGIPLSDEGTLAEALSSSEVLVRRAVENLEPKCADARGDLDSIYQQLENLAQTLRDVREDITCARCGAYANDGEGADGDCGSCADRADVARFPHANDCWPVIGDKVAMGIDDEIEIVIAEIPISQPYLASDIWLICDQYAEEHTIESNGSWWETTVSTDPLLMQQQNSAGMISFAGIFIENDDDVPFETPRCWRGVLTQGGSALRSTSLLFETAQEACLAAVELAEGLSISGTADFSAQ